MSHQKLLNQMTSTELDGLIKEAIQHQKRQKEKEEKKRKDSYQTLLEPVLQTPEFKKLQKKFKVLVEEEKVRVPFTFTGHLDATLLWNDSDNLIIETAQVTLDKNSKIETEYDEGDFQEELDNLIYEYRWSIVYKNVEKKEAEMEKFNLQIKRLEENQGIASKDLLNQLWDDYFDTPRKLD